MLNWQDKLFKKTLGVIKPGLQRMQQAYEQLGRPAAEIPTVLIGGTNGKGTTAALLWKLLALNGQRVGVFSSPHLVEFRERFQMSHALPTDAELSASLERIESGLDTRLYEELSFFELSTLMAFDLFHQCACQSIILEVGLGGRLDATNIADPICSAIVSIGLDHQRYLGDTLPEIFGEKLGIARKGRPLIWGASGAAAQDSDCQAFFEQRCQQLNFIPYVRAHDFGFAASDQIRLGSDELLRPDGTYSWFFQGQTVVDYVPAALLSKPRFLQHNFSVALALYHCLCERHPDRLQPLGKLLKALDDDHGPSAVCGMGRYLSIELPEDRGGSRRLVVDVCHNVDGIEAHVQAKQNDISLHRPLALVSILNDKNINAMLDRLRLEYNDHLLLFQIPNERSLTQNDLAERHRGLKLFDSFELAWQHALRKRPSQKDSLVICGSVLAVGHVLEYFKLYPLEMANHMAAL